MSKIKSLPKRDQVKPSDCWDLASLFKTDAAWEKAFAHWTRSISSFQPFRGKLGDSASMLANCLQFDADLDRAAEKLSRMRHCEQPRIRPIAMLSG